LDGLHNLIERINPAAVAFYVRALIFRNKPEQISGIKMLSPELGRAEQAFRKF
jgi:hypothetical protein